SEGLVAVTRDDFLVAPGGHGRIETRTLKAVTVNIPGGLGFAHAAQAVRITRTRTIARKTTRETAYLIVTLPAEAAQPTDEPRWPPGSATTRTPTRSAHRRRRRARTTAARAAPRIRHS